METKDIFELWGRYIKELYENPKRTSIPILFEGDLSGPEILELEIEQAVKQSKVGKTTGPDNIICEMLKTLGKDGIGVLAESTWKGRCRRTLYNQRALPKEMFQSIFVPLPKKPGTLLYEEHRTVIIININKFQQFIYSRHKKLR